MPNSDNSFLLQRALPPGLTVRGASGLLSDGANIYRVVEGGVLSITLKDAIAGYLGFSSEVFSQRSGFTAVVSVDGRPLEEFAVPGNKLASYHTGTTVGPGQHTIRVVYSCDGQLCSQAIAHYATTIQNVAVVLPSAVVQIGLGAERWNLEVPESRIRAIGVSGTQYDGNQLFRLIKYSPVRFSWATTEQPIYLSFRVWSSEAYHLNLKVRDKTVYSATGSARTGAFVNTSLIAYRGLDGAVLNVHCQTPGKVCATVSQVSLAVRQQEKMPWGLALLATLIGVVLAGFLLGLISQLGRRKR